MKKNPFHGFELYKKLVFRWLNMLDNYVVKSMFKILLILAQVYI